MKALAAFVAALALFLASADQTADAEHSVWLPGLPTALMRNLWADGEITWCVDDRAAAYPGFTVQLEDVVAAYNRVTGIPGRQVAVGGGCDVMHLMPDSFPCGAGAAGCVYYDAYPVVTVYQYRLGYSDWRTVHGHELGHAYLGLHEQYRDSGGQIACLPDRVWTVMSCRTGVRYPQVWDRDRGWEVLLPRPLSNFYGTGERADGSRYLYYYRGTDARADRIAIMALAPWGETYWTGNQLPVVDGYVELELVSEPGWCFLANQEISGWAESWLRPEMRNDVLLGCVA